MEKFKTNACLSLITKKLIYDEGKGESKEEILENALNLITYVIEDIPTTSLDGKDINKIVSGFVQSQFDPAIPTLLNHEETFAESKVIIDQLLGSSIPVKKMDVSYIEKIHEFQKRKMKK